MPRVRLGVVLLMPPPLNREIDALRRAVGDGTYGRVPAHLTLVPPVNVNEGDMAEALFVLRTAAGATRPFTVHLGPPHTFLPANPVLYLPLVGDGRADVFALRERVFRPPLARDLTWPFVPHVTIADEAKPERIEAAETALADYAAEVSFDRLHLLQEQPRRVWEPVADAEFLPAAVIGRGGLPLEISVSERLDPEARTFTDCAWQAEGQAEHGEPFNLAVVGRRERRVVAAAEGWARRGTAFVASVIVARDVRGEGIGSHVLAAFEAAALDRGCTRLSTRVMAGTPAEQFYLRHGWVEDVRLVDWRDGRDAVHLRRDHYRDR